MGAPDYWKRVSMMWRSLQIDEDSRWITASEICIILHIIWKPLLILGWRNVQMSDYHCRADAVILNVTTPSVAPSSQGTGYAGFQVTGLCMKKECVHISAQRVPYFGTTCERCITFPRATKEIGHVPRHAGYFFHWCRIPILIKQNSLLCRHKNWRFLVCCIRRHTDIFRFILIFYILYFIFYSNLSYHYILCSARNNEYVFLRTNFWQR